MKIGLKLPKKAPAQGSSTVAAGPVSLTLLWIVAAGGVAVVLVALALFLFAHIGSEQRAASTRDSERLLGLLTGQVADAMRSYDASMDYVAGDPTLAQALQSGDVAVLRQREDALIHLFPSALKVRILPPGLSQPDSSSNPPLSYACLNLLHEAETHVQPPAAEVHNFGTPSQHIDLARRIVAPDGRVVGDVLVSLAVPVLQQSMKRLKLASGYVELQQKLPDGKLLALAAQGDKADRSGTPSRLLPIPGTRWQLAYWAGGIELPANMVMFGGAFGVAVLVLALLMFVISRVLASALRQDQVSVLKLAKALAEGSPAAGFAARLRDCRGVIEQLQFMIRERPAAATKAAKEQAQAEEAPFGDVDMGSLSEALEFEEVADEAAETPSTLPTHIFRAYDIRGVVGDTLTPEIVEKIGRAIGSEAYARGQQKVVVARDGRLSGPDLSAALIKGLVASGREVVDVGRVPTPVLYFATQYLGSGSGVMVTGSHNPKDYNGLKIMLRGETLHDEAIQALRQRIETGNLINGKGKVDHVDVLPSYLERITSDVRLARPLKVVIDCGNGVAGEGAPQLFRELGCEVVELYCDVDGNFPNHHPDPGKPENLMDLTRAVSEHGADLGVAFDGDGDRLGVVDSDGKIIWPDRVLMLLAIDVLLRQPGAQIIYDVKCSRHLEQVITEHGGVPLMSKTGHSFIKARMQATGAQLAGELSGHIFFQERWYGFDDALYACARLLEVLAQDPRPSSAVFGDLPESVSTPELNVPMAEGEHYRLMQQLLGSANFAGAKLITIDGLRVEFPDGWGLVRASNTTPVLVLRFEAEDAESLRRIQDQFRKQLLALAPGLALPF